MTVDLEVARDQVHIFSLHKSEVEHYILLFITFSYTCGLNQSLSIRHIP